MSYLPPISSASYQHNYDLVDDSLTYNALLLEGISREEVLKILSIEPKCTLTKEWLKNIAYELAIQFELSTLPDWMIGDPELFKLNCLFYQPEAVFEILTTDGNQRALYNSFGSEDNKNKEGENIFHYACKWEDHRKIELLKLLIQNCYDACKPDNSGNHPFSHILESEAEDFINMLSETICPISCEENISKISNEYTWMKVLIQYPKLIVTKAFAQLKPYTLADITFEEGDTEYKTARFINGKLSSCLSYIEDLKILKIYIDIWDSTIGKKTKFPGIIFLLLSTQGTDFFRKIALYNLEKRKNEILISPSPPYSSLLETLNIVQNKPTFPNRYRRNRVLSSYLAEEYQKTAKIPSSFSNEIDIDAFFYFCGMYKQNLPTRLYGEVDLFNQFLERIGSTSDINEHYREFWITSFSNYINFFNINIENNLNLFIKLFNTIKNQNILKLYLKEGIESLMNNVIPAHKEKLTPLHFLCSYHNAQSDENLYYPENSDLVFTAFRNVVERLNFKEMPPSEIIITLNFFLCVYSELEQRNILKKSHLIELGSIEINQYLISKGINKISLMNVPLDLDSLKTMEAWVNAGGSFINEIVEPIECEDVFDRMIYLVQKYESIKNYLKKNLNLYAITPSKNNHQNVTLWKNILNLACLLNVPLFQKHFHSGFKRPYECLNELFSKKGYLIKIDKQNLNSQEGRRNYENLLRTTDSAYKKISPLITRDNVEICLVKENMTYYILARRLDTLKPVEIKVEALFNESGYEILTEQLIKTIRGYQSESEFTINNSFSKSDVNKAKTRTPCDTIIPYISYNRCFYYYDFVKATDNSTYILKKVDQIHPHFFGSETFPLLNDAEIRLNFEKYYFRKNKSHLFQLYQDILELFPNTGGDPRKLKRNQSEYTFIYDTRIENHICEIYNMTTAQDLVDIISGSDDYKDYMTQRETSISQPVLETNQKSSIPLITLTDDTDETENRRTEPVAKRNRSDDIVIHVQGKRQRGRETLSPSNASILVDDELEVRKPEQRKISPFEYAMEKGYLYRCSMSSQYKLTSKGALYYLKLKKIITDSAHPESSSSSSSSSYSPEDEFKAVFQKVTPNKDISKIYVLSRPLIYTAASSSIPSISEVTSSSSSSFHSPPPSSNAKPQTFEERFKNIQYNNSGDIESIHYTNPLANRIALFIYTRHDLVEEFKVDANTQTILMKLSERYSIKFVRCKNNNELIDLITHVQKNSIGILWLGGHSSPTSLEWGNPSDPNTVLNTYDNSEYSSRLENALRESMTVDGSIFIEGCEAGGAPVSGKDNLVDYFAKRAPGRFVYGPKIKLSKNTPSGPEISFISVVPFDVQILQGDVDQTYRSNFTE